MKAKEILIILALLTLTTYFLIVGTIEAAGFLKPLAISLLLVLICIPLSRKLESWKIPKGLSALLCVLLSLLLFISFFVIISAQISNIAERWPEIKAQMEPKIEDVQQSMKERTGVDLQQQFEILFPSTGYQPESSSENSSESSTPSSKTTSSSSSKNFIVNASQQIGVFVMNFFSFLGNTAITLVYLFFLLYYRNKVKLSVLKFFDAQKRQEAKEVMDHSIELALNFIVGRFTLILFLAIIYSIGLSVSGIENAILISAIAAMLSLVPYIGNIIGYVLSMAMAIFAGAHVWGLVGVTVTFGIAQFVESYILEPYVVGSKVELNPLVTIIVVVLGGSMWGVAGMILSIPIAGIAKIIFDATPALEKFGYALGEEDIEGADEQNFLSKWGEKLWNKISK